MKEERFPHTRKPLRGQRQWVAEGGSFGATEESAATGVRRAKRRDSRTERIGANQHSPAREACVLTRRGRRRLGAEAQASEVRSQGEDWGWLREHNLKGASAPQLAGRESRKKYGPAKESRDHCFLVREERGFRALLKGAPETGASRGYQRGPQRRA